MNPRLTRWKRRQQSANGTRIQPAIWRWRATIQVFAIVEGITFIAALAILYSIAAEALRNSFQHAQPRQVAVDIRYDNEQFRLRLRDEGNGIEPSVLSRQGIDRHFGLHGMQERAKLV